MARKFCCCIKQKWMLCILKGREKREEKWMQNCGDDAKKFVAASNRDAHWYFKWRERERAAPNSGDDG